MSEPTTILSDQWCFTKEELQNSPSILDGMTIDEEQDNRVKGCQFIKAVAAVCNIKELPVFTACIYLNRFYMRHSMYQFNHYEIGAACLFLACRAENHQVNLQKFIVTCIKKARKDNNHAVDEDGREYKLWYERVTERYQFEIVQALAFDFEAPNPVAYLFELAEKVGVVDDESIIIDVFLTLFACASSPLCLLYDSKLIAAGALLVVLSQREKEDEVNKKKYEDMGDGVLRDFGSIDSSRKVLDIAVEITEFIEKHSDYDN